MKLSARTIKAVGKIVTGDGGMSPYRSGPKLVDLFNDYGADDQYGEGFPSRWLFAEQKLRGLNGTSGIGALICEVCDPREYIDADLDVDTVLDYLNKFLAYDGFELVQDRGRVRIRDVQGVSVDFQHPFQKSDQEGHHFIEEQTKKAESKIQEGDYDGAITNARSLLEAVLTEIEGELDDKRPSYDGNLPRLYKRVQKLLSLEPGRTDIEGPLKQTLSGLNSIVEGISAVSNKMGDRHVRTYKPAKRHAVLVVNAAKTVASFLFETHEFRRKDQPRVEQV